ncbi:hypothetical protein LguiA_035660 [Lonicera macranthoides]
MVSLTPHLKQTMAAKELLPYLQRADELQKHQPLVSYYCRLYAMERGLKIPQSERSNALLVSLVKQLEKDKMSLKSGTDDNLHLEGFASSIFAKADNQDWAGRADLYAKSTAKTFYAASIFFEIINQFGELQPDLEQKQKYAAWKAADIRKALKEGRKPVPGPPDWQTSRTDLDIRPAPESDGSPQPYSEVDPQDFSNSLLSPPYPEDNYPSHNSHQPPSTNGSINSTNEYNSHNYNQPPPANRFENSTYSEPYQHQPYPQEPQRLPHAYPSHEIPSSYPNFQSYPSFAESNLPAIPSQYIHYQGSDASYSAPLNGQRDSSRRNGIVLEAVPTSSAQPCEYDNNYQPLPEKIAEAHKAARFAVGALAFDDVSIAVDLRESLELLMNPSAAGK